MNTIKNWSIYTTEALEIAALEIEMELKTRNGTSSFREQIKHTDQPFFGDSLKEAFPNMGKAMYKAIMWRCKTMLDRNKGTNVYTDLITTIEISSLSFKDTLGVRGLGAVQMSKINKVLTDNGYSPIPYGKEAEKEYQLARKNKYYNN